MQVRVVMLTRWGLVHLWFLRDRLNRFLDEVVLVGLRANQIVNAILG